MIELKCDCGSWLEVPAGFANEPAACPRCGRALRAIAGGPLDEQAPPPSCRLVVGAAPVEAAAGGGPAQGEHLLLAGDHPVEVGKAEGKPLRLPGKLVSRSHCRLVPTGTGWRVEDAGSTNGLFINGARVQAHALRHGDVVGVGEYQLRYLCGDGFTPVDAGAGPEEVSAHASTGATAPPPPPRPIRHVAPTPPAGLVPEHSLAVAALGPPLTCPSCRRTKNPGEAICVECGIHMRTGRPLLLSQALDENALAERAENTIRVISWLVPTGWTPIGSEAFGTHRPYVIWALAVVTLLASFWYFGTTWGGGEQYPPASHLMLWSGDARWIGRSFDPAGLPARQRDEYRRFERSRGYEELVRDPEIARFRPYQLVTHALLHGSILHLAGNLVFMLVLGLRVNALAGNVRTAVVYPLLAAAGGAAQVLADAHGPLHPSLGASGAVMGLAGMYLVLFPVHRVYMCVWLRMGLFAGFQLLMKVWPVRGFWVVLFYVSFDVLATLFGEDDGVGHWAHLGGFAAGAFVALLLLVSRQVNARGGDLVSVTLGKHAWALVGRPRADDPVGLRVPGPAPA